MNVADSSAWLEYFADGPNSKHFAPAIEDPEHLIVPTLTLFEVFKRLLQQRTEEEALMAIAVMQLGTVVDLSATLAIDAAKFSHTARLPLADSIIYTTAKAYNATLWTQDGDFDCLENVEYRKAKSRKAG